MPQGTPKGERYKGCTITTRPGEDNKCWSGVIMFKNKDKKHVPQRPTKELMLKHARELIDDYYSCAAIANKFLSMKLL